MCPAVRKETLFKLCAVCSEVGERFVYMASEAGENLHRLQTIHHGRIDNFVQNLIKGGVGMNTLGSH